MKLIKRLPDGRTYEQVRNHFLVEREIARRLKEAGREERKRIYATMYDTLFQKVPDHPRLSAKEDAAAAQARNRQKFGLVERYVKPSHTFVEFAPGDGAFARFMCGIVKRVITVDISDQTADRADLPENLTPLVYDGYNLDCDGIDADMVFSDQFIEHLHPDDIVGHFSLVKSMLKKGGRYVIRTPHAFLGPHDISKYFSTIPQGFHLHECTCSELGEAAKRLGYGSSRGHVKINKRYVPAPFFYFRAVESALSPLPRPLQKLLSRPLLPRNIYMVMVS